MIKFPMVSVIIPTYNRIDLLKQAVRSCLNQTMQNIEIIIVDDGSTDGTENIVTKLLNNEWSNQRINFFKQKNAGASAARNFGLSKAKGHYIQFLDSDDLLYPRKLELQLAEIEKYKADVCSSFGEMGCFYEAAENETLGVSFENKLDLMHKMCSGNVHVMCTPAPLWRKSIIDATEGWNETIAFGDDLEYHIRLLTKASKICLVPEKLFFVREHADLRLSDAKGNVKQVESGIKTQNSIYSTLQKNNLWDNAFQNGLLNNMRTLYANYMKLASSKELYDFESELIKIAKNPTTNTFAIILVAIRRLVGANFILTIFKLKKRIFS